MPFGRCIPSTGGALTTFPTEVSTRGAARQSRSPRHWGAVPFVPIIRAAGARTSGLTLPDPHATVGVSLPEGRTGREVDAPGRRRLKALDQKRLTKPNLICDPTPQALDLTRSRASAVKRFAFLPTALARRAGPAAARQGAGGEHP